MTKNEKNLKTMSVKSEKKINGRKEITYEKKIEMSRGYCRHYHMKKGC